MPAGRLTDLKLVAAAGILTVVFAAAAALIAPPAEGTSGHGSSYSASSRGSKAAYETLRALGYRVERSLEPLASLRTDPRETVLIVTGSRPASDQDRRAARELLSNGGTLLAVGAEGAALLGGTGRAIPDLLGRPSLHHALGVSPVTQGVSRITMTAPEGEINLPAEFVPLFATSATSPLVAVGRVGAGRAIWLAAATPLMNEEIRRSDNLPLLLNIAGAPGAARVLWDEHYHGHSRSLWSYAAHTPLPWMAAQCALIGIAVVATFSRRVAPVRTRIQETRTSPFEFIEMLRVLYERAGAAGHAIGSARTRFRRKVLAATGLPAASDDLALARAAAALCSASEDELRALLANSSAAAAEPVRPERAVQLSARLQALSIELDDPARRTRRH